MINDKKCKKCRREGQKLFLKGERCYSAKCPLVKRKYPPGIHGPKGYPKLTAYGLQLREKQKLKRIFGLSEKQLKIYFKKASRKKGQVADNLLKFLEMRLDNVIYRANFCDSRSAARQMINHGHLIVNNRKINIPSYQVKKGDEIILKSNSQMREKVKKIFPLNKEKKEIPDWLSIDETKLSIKIMRNLESIDLAKEIEVKFIVEFYSR